MTDEGKLQEIQDNIEALKYMEEVVEVRILGTSKGTVSGYFDDFTELVKNIQSYIGKHDIYMTLNPVKEDLLSRCNNRLQDYAKQTTSDNDIESISYILIDFDPVRPSGISSTMEEKAAAKKLAKKVCKDLKKEGLTEVVMADSGNGFHLLLPVDLENTKDNIGKVKEFLRSLDFLYSTDQVQVDLTTYNPSRIVKMYGTQACKGDDTETRPHRWSKLLQLPDEIEPSTREQIQLIIDKTPQVEQVKKSRDKGQGKKLDVLEFIEKYGLDLAFQGPYQNQATKYILKTCPWNSDHTNNAAYIIQFESGGIAAGCHHNGCADENWQTLKELLGVETMKQDTSKDAGKEEKQSDIVIDLAKDCQLFTNDMDEPFAAVNIDGHWEVMQLTSKRYALYLTKLYFEEKRSAPGTDALGQALKVLEMKAIFSENEKKLQKRIAFDEGTYYYDLCNPKWEVVRMSENGCEIETNPPILFTRTNNMKEQVKPDLSVEPEELIELIKKHLRFKKESDTILFAAYLVSCFLPQISHVILVLFGEKGAAKSTTMRMIKQIVDPAMQDLLSMPTSKQDLAIVLSNNYMPCFDNLDSLSAEKSDMLCMAATGGAFTKRTLYTNDDETILRFKRCVALNGINIVATRPDLLDRSIVLELDRIPKTERKTEKAIWASFDADRERFLGAIFNTISKASVGYDEIELTQVGRMADFTYWGYVIAEELELGGENFLSAYLGNQNTANEEALASHPVAAAVIAFMKDTHDWESSVSALLKELETVADKERINTRVRTWPKDPNVLSKRLKEVKSNLEEIGIYYDIRHAGQYKKITIHKKTEDNE